MNTFFMNKTILARSLALILVGGALAGCNFGVEDDKVITPEYNESDETLHEALYAPIAFEFKDVKAAPIGAVGTSALYGYAQVVGIPYTQITVPVWVEGEGAQYALASYSYNPNTQEAFYTCADDWKDTHEVEHSDDQGNVTTVTEPEKTQVNGLQFICVRLDPTSDAAPKVYSDEASLTLYIGDSSRVIKKFDEDGNQVFEDVLDDEGNPVPERDNDGNIVYQKDENGQLILDGEGNPIAVIQQAAVTVPSVVSDDFIVSLEDRDVVPAPLDLNIANDDLQPAESLVCSDPSVLADINDKVFLTASSGASFKINDVAVANGATAYVGDAISACLTTPAGQAQAAEMSLTISALVNWNDPTDPSDPNYVPPVTVATATFAVTTHPGDLPPLMDVQFPPAQSATMKSELSARGRYFIDPRLVNDGATLKSLTINGNPVQIAEDATSTSANWSYELTGLTSGENRFELVAVATTKSGDKTDTRTLVVEKVASFDGAFPASHTDFSLLADVGFDARNNRLLVLDNGADKILSFDLTTGAQSNFVDLLATLPLLAGSAVNPDVRGLEIDEAYNRVLLSEKNKSYVYEYKLANPEATGNYKVFATNNPPKESGATNSSGLRQPSQLAIHPGTFDSDGNAVSGAYLIVANANRPAAIGNSGIARINLQTGMTNQVIKGDNSMNFAGWSVDVYADGASNPIFWISNLNNLYKLDLSSSTGGNQLASEYEISLNEVPVFETPTLEINGDFLPRSIAIDDEKGILLATNVNNANGQANILAIDIKGDGFTRSVFADNSNPEQAPLDRMASLYEHPGLGYYVALIYKANGAASYNGIIAIDKATGDRVVIAKDAIAP